MKIERVAEVFDAGKEYTYYFRDTKNGNWWMEPRNRERAYPIKFFREELEAAYRELKEGKTDV